MVLTAKSPQVTPGGVAARPGPGWQDAVSAWSFRPAAAAGEAYRGELIGMPFESTTEYRSSAPPSFGAAGQVGAAAAPSHWWLRKEPPNAAWKKLSAIA